MKMAKKEKSIEKRRKGYKRRGIFYCVMLVLLIAATIVVNIEPVEKAINRAVFPKSRIVTIEGEQKEVFSEVSTEEGVDVSAYYILDENGEKQYVQPTYRLNQIATIQTGFLSDAKVKLTIIKSAVTGLLVLFIILFVIYLMRLSYYVSTYDDEWRRKAGDKMLGLRMGMDKISTKFAEKSKARKEKAAAKKEEKAAEKNDEESEEAAESDAEAEE